MSPDVLRRVVNRQGRALRRGNVGFERGPIHREKREREEKGRSDESQAGHDGPIAVVSGVDLEVEENSLLKESTDASEARHPEKEGKPGAEERDEKRADESRRPPSPLPRRKARDHEKAETDEKGV